jgi:hypothetical protein
VRSKLIPVEEAIGHVLPHDVTMIVPGQFKGARFKKGHIIREEDIQSLKPAGRTTFTFLSLSPMSFMRMRLLLGLPKLAVERE